jgi:hypothetical protein
MKKRRLSDLYVRGRELSVNDGEGEPIKVWVSKLNEIDRESVLRRANAAKARFMIDADDEDSEQFAAMYAESRDINSRHELILFIVSDDVNSARRRIESQTAGDEETWSKEGYLQGLVDAWIGDETNPGLSATIQEDPADPEARRVSDELDRFEQEVRARVEAETHTLVKDWEDVDIDVLRRKATHLLLELKSSEEFVREFQRQQIFYSIREPNDHRKRYFATITEVDDLDEELRKYLVEQYESLVVPPDEGKESPPPADSSNSSDAPEEAPETSGLVAASA